MNTLDEVREAAWRAAFSFYAVQVPPVGSVELIRERIEAAARAADVAARQAIDTWLELGGTELVPAARFGLLSGDLLDAEHAMHRGGLDYLHPTLLAGVGRQN